MKRSFAVALAATTAALGAALAAPTPAQADYVVSPGGYCEYSDIYGVFGLYQYKNFGGYGLCHDTTGNIQNLAGRYFYPGGPSFDNTPSSVENYTACYVTLHQFAGYTGAYTTSYPETYDADLSNDAIGDNRTSSVSMSC